MQFVIPTLSEAEKGRVLFLRSPEKEDEIPGLRFPGGWQEAHKFPTFEADFVQVKVLPHSHCNTVFPFHDLHLERRSHSSLKKSQGSVSAFCANGKLLFMNRIQLRNEVSLWAQKAEAKDESEQPGAADVEALKGLWDLRKTPSILSASVSSTIDVIYGADPDWNSWRSIAARFKAYCVALVDIDNRLSSPMAAIRLHGA